MGMTLMLTPIPHCTVEGLPAIVVTSKLIIQDKTALTRAIVVGPEVEVVHDLLVMHMQEVFPMATRLAGYQPATPHSVLENSRVEALYYYYRGPRGVRGFHRFNSSWILRVVKDGLGIRELSLENRLGLGKVGYRVISSRRPPRRFSLIRTDRGARRVNEDSLGYLALLYCAPSDHKHRLLRAIAVADGVGGLDLGSLASGGAIFMLFSEIVRAFLTDASLDDDSISKIIHYINNQLYNVSAMLGKRFGSTLAVSIFESHEDKGALVSASVGDTAIYQVSAGHGATRVNPLHRAIINGRYALTSYLGGPRSVSSLWASKSIIGTDLEGGAIVIMSDGVHDYVEERRLNELITGARQGAWTPHEALDAMIYEAKMKGSTDNLSVALMVI